MESLSTYAGGSAACPGLVGFNPDVKSRSLIDGVGTRCPNITFSSRDTFRASRLHTSYDGVLAK